MIAVSIVSHGHGPMATRLIVHLLTCPDVHQIVWTRNIPEDLAVPSDPRLVVIDNVRPKGFGANHNAAFRRCTQPYFCILNPDIECDGDPFPALIATLERENAGLIAPQIVSPTGAVEDNMRSFPTVARLFAKLVGVCEGRTRVASDATLARPDWVAGMFMLTRAAEFAAVGGFDESYFLYYEDVELCTQFKAAGTLVIGDLTVSVVHHARRASRRDWQHFRWHLASMVRYLWRHAAWRPIGRPAQRVDVYSTGR